MRNGFADAFSTWRDRLLLAAMLLLAGAWLANGSKPLFADWRVDLGLPFGVAAAAQTRIARALDRLVATSPLAADALDKQSRLGYGLTRHAIAFAGACGGLWLLAPNRLTFALPAYLCGIVPPYVLRALVRRLPMKPAVRRPPSAVVMNSPIGWRGLATAVARWQVGQRWAAAGVLFACSATAAVALIVSLFAGRSAAGVAFALAALVVMWRLSRADHPIVSFAAYAGYGTSASLGAHAVACAMTGILLAGLALPIGGVRLAAAVAALSASALIVLAARIPVYRLYPKRRADMMLTLVGVVAALTMSTMPFLLPPLLIGVAATLARRSRTATWLSR